MSVSLSKTRVVANARRDTQRAVASVLALGSAEESTNGGPLKYDGDKPGSITANIYTALNNLMMSYAMYYNQKTPRISPDAEVAQLNLERLNKDLVDLSTVLAQEVSKAPVASTHTQMVAATLAKTQSFADTLQEIINFINSTGSYSKFKSEMENYATGIRVGAVRGVDPSIPAYLDIFVGMVNTIQSSYMAILEGVKKMSEAIVVHQTALVHIYQGVPLIESENTAVAGMRVMINDEPVPVGTDPNSIGFVEDMNDPINVNFYNSDKTIKITKPIQMQQNVLKVPLSIMIGKVEGMLDSIPTYQNRLDQAKFDLAYQYLQGHGDIAEKCRTIYNAYIDVLRRQAELRNHWWPTIR